MKKVYKTDPDNIVHISNISKNKYYGIVNKSNEKGFLVADNYGSDFYKAQCKNGINDGDHFGIPALLKIKIENLIESQFEIFEFDTPGELFAWLAKD